MEISLRIFIDFIETLYDERRLGPEQVRQRSAELRENPDRWHPLYFLDLSKCHPEDHQPVVSQ